MPEMKASRAEVYAAIDSERAYQDQGRGNAERTGDDKGVELTSGELILVMEEILLHARQAYYKPGGTVLAAPFIRKVAGCAVQFGERFGMPAREGHAVPFDGRGPWADKKEGKKNAKPEAKS